MRIGRIGKLNKSIGIQINPSESKLNFCFLIHFYSMVHIFFLQMNEVKPSIFYGTEFFQTRGIILSANLNKVSL